MPNDSKQLEVDILVPDSLKGETLRAPLTITYSNAHGDRITESRIVDFYVKGLIDISVNNVRVLEISEKNYIAGDIVNEGNDDGLFGYVTINPIGNSNILSTQNFLDEIEVESPVPFNVPIKFDGLPQYGEHELEIEIRYKDALREEHFVTQNAVIFLEEPKTKDKPEISPLIFLLPIIIIGIIIFILLRKKRHLSFQKTT
jgi:hypothetical protein